MANIMLDLGSLIKGMREAYKNGQNAMAYAREKIGNEDRLNATIATLIAYDLQSGSYVDYARQNQHYNAEWCNQLSEILSDYVNPASSILEAGCGEATTLAGTIKNLGKNYSAVLGFDISWSRLHIATNWVNANGVSAELFVADLFEIPLKDDAVDLLYTSHSLEPNGGREELALRELLRVSSEYVILIEPLYELANENAKKRMEEHGYVKGLKKTAECIGAEIVDYRLLDVSANELNPSGLIVLKKKRKTKKKLNLQVKSYFTSKSIWQCPLTHTPLNKHYDVYISPDTGLVYPVLRGIPLLRGQHAIIASKILE